VPTYTKVGKLFKHSVKITVLVEDNLTVFKQAHDATETSQFIRTKSFDRVPDQVKKTIAIQADTLEVSL